MRIFIHSLKLIFDNFGQALRLTLVPYLVMTVISFFVELYVLANIEWRWPILLLLLPANFLVGLWAAVLWHRYILLDEAADGWVPHLMWDRVGAYFVRLLWVTLVLCVAGGAVGVLVAIVSRIGLGYSAAVWIAFIFAAPIASYRLMPVAVAAAVGRPLGLMDAWKATSGNMWTFALLALVTILVLGALVVIGSVVGRLSWIFAIAWSVGVGWLVQMLLISLLTTVYGHFIEKRPIG